MALEWAGHGIEVNAVAPGLIDRIAERPARIPGSAAGGQRAGRTTRHPGTWPPRSSSFSEQAGYVSGVELLVDGGVTMSIISAPRPSSVDSVGPGGGRSVTGESEPRALRRTQVTR
ncbi:MAG: hypothetical protein R2716_13725 [Microthrixaceae bacterium]